MNLKTILTLLSLFTVTILKANIYTVAEMGIYPDAEKVNTECLQQALNTVASKGGGILKFSVGDYITGTLEIPSGVGIYLDKEARILGSINPFDYAGYDPNDSRELSGLISADKVSDISISGEGTIDGRGLELALAIDSLHHIGIRPDRNYN
ncbi:MAG: glycoside hydrolase family 28 protein, partial [Muribaculaceae bacterium]|nr:glycoside hydrolase family 28 protein [Muribaculaceae bacterium]